MWLKVKQFLYDQNWITEKLFLKLYISCSYLLSLSLFGDEIQFKHETTIHSFIWKYISFQREREKKIKYNTKHMLDYTLMKINTNYILGCYVWNWFWMCKVNFIMFDDS